MLQKSKTVVIPFFDYYHWMFILADTLTNTFYRFSEGITCKNPNYARVFDSMKSLGIRYCRIPPYN